MAKVVNHDIKCGEEGVHIDHELVPFPSGSGSRPTLERGCLPLKFRADNSHQAFNNPGYAGGALCRMLQAHARNSLPYALYAPRKRLPHTLGPLCGRSIRLSESELRRISVPRTPVNKGKKKGRSLVGRKLRPYEESRCAKHMGNFPMY